MESNNILRESNSKLMKIDDVLRACDSIPRKDKSVFIECSEC